jgi:large subunit ribosomal protein L54
LANFCCGLNILAKDGEEVPIKADSEYPDWLWQLKIDGSGPDIEDMEKDTMEYWSRKRCIGLRYKNQLMKKQFPEPFIPNKIKKLRLA